MDGWFHDRRGRPKAEVAKAVLLLQQAPGMAEQLLEESVVPLWVGAQSKVVIGEVD